jgi:hypothetical protein
MENGADKCPLCGTDIDKGRLYREFSAKGDSFLSMGDYGRAVLSYKSALDTSYPPDAAFYIKYGNALDKKKDRLAAGMYLKAISLDFHNDRAHDLLIAFYDGHNRLAELKEWYERSGGPDKSFADKQAKKIDSILDFRANPPAIAVGAVKAQGPGIIKAAVKGFKRYIILNIVLSIVSLMLLAGVAMAYFFKVNLIVFAAICAVFLFASAGAVALLRRRRASSLKKEAEGLEKILDEFRAGGKTTL